MSQTTEDLARLARLAITFEHRRVFWVGFQEKIRSADRLGIVVAGESALLDELGAFLTKAQTDLEQLEQSTSVALSRPLLADLESVLTDVSWDVAEQILADLTVKEIEQTQRMREYESQYAEWGARIRELSQLAEQARHAGANVYGQIDAVIRVQAIAEQTERFLRDRQVAPFLEALERLKKERTAVDQLSAQIKERMEGVRSFAQRADLFLLRSGEAKDLVEYTVMLRQPGDVNIQDSSTVVRQDDLLMRGTVDEVTSRINRGLARAFEQGKSPAAPPAAEAPVAAEGPAVAPPVAAVPAGGEAPATAETDGLRDARRVSSPGGGAQGASEDVNDLADRYGGMMYRLFMPEQIQRYLADAPYSITLTTNELELPWELMRSDRSENKYLCLDRPVARMPTGHVSPNITDVARPGGKARFILIADPTQNLPGARREAEIIQQRLAEQWKDRIDITLLQGKDAQGARLNEVLYNGTYDVIHYAGHAAFDENNPERSALLLSGDEIFLAQKIRRLLRGRPLVFLNACESGKTANEQEQAPQVGYLQKPAAGLASSFIYGGAKGCIGSLWPVYDDSAAEFAVAFYGRVLDGHMIGEAMRQTRIEIRQRFPRQITWASFVLYGDPTQRIAYPSA